jgi:hypothetical protein
VNRRRGLNFFNLLGPRDRGKQKRHCQPATVFHGSSVFRADYFARSERKPLHRPTDA